MRRKIVGWLGALFIMSFAAGGFFVMFGRNASSEESALRSVITEGEEWTITGLDEILTYGEEAKMPTATVKIDGVLVNAESYIVYPNGTACTGNTFTLSSAGKYTAVFYAESNGKYAKTERVFTIDAPYVSCGSSSSYEYGQYTKFDSTENNEGYLLRIAEGDEITFNKIIEISDLSSSDCLIDLFITPDNESADFETLILKFTDAIDSDVYLKVTVHRVSPTAWVGSNRCQYVKAAGNGQSLTGIEQYGLPAEKVNVENAYGTCISVPFDAKNNDAAGSMIVPSQFSMRLFFDQENNQLKVNNGLVVADFDDWKYFSTLWNGFPSGKAKLSISASGYNSKTANLCIREIFGFDFSDNTVVDVIAPEINVITDYTEMPIAETGTKYAVPNATAVDNYLGVCPVSTKILYGKGTGKEFSVVLEDGYFIPSVAGEYYIIYSATDGYGNIAEKEIKVIATRKVSPITLNVPEYFEYDYGEYLDILPAVVTGGSGNVSTVIKVFNNGEEKNIERGKVKLDGYGDWEVVYTATDYLGKTQTATVKIKTDCSDEPIFSEEPVLPNIMIAGSKYTFEKYYAESYSGQTIEKILCNVKVTDALGVHEFTGGETYIPTVLENGDAVSIEYSANGKIYGPFTIPVITAKTVDDDGYDVVDMSKYFYGKDITAVAESSGVTIRATQAGDVKWTFANALLSEIFSIELGKFEGKAKFGGFRIILTDACDKDVAVYAEILFKRSGTVLQSGANSQIISEDFFSDNAVSITLGYCNGIFKAGNVEVAASTLTDVDFNGFSENKVNLEVVAINAEEGAEYEVKTISLHRFNTEREDYTSPQIYIDGLYGGEYDKDAVYAIPAAYAADVLAPNVSMTLTVTLPSGETAKDIDGKELYQVDPSKEYRLLLEEYGQYKIVYKAIEVDWFGQNKTLQYLIKVSDGEAPVLTIGEYKTTANVGDAFRIPTVKATDDRTEEKNIITSITVCNPQGKILTISGEYFIFEQVGTYEFRIFAMDENGNTSFKTFSVTVGDKSI